MKKTVVWVLMLIMLSASLIASVHADTDATAASEFLTPVTHQKSVPSGYTAIRTAADLEKVRSNLSGKFILMNDIDMGYASFTPIGAYNVETIEKAVSFSGIFDGNGWTIKNIDITVSAASQNLLAGFFASVSGEVKNLCVTGNLLATSNTALSAGGIAGYLFEGGKITNCINKIIVIGNCDWNQTDENQYTFCGGVVGKSFGNVSSARNFASVSSRRAGGIAGGQFGGLLSGCYNSGDINGLSSLSTVCVGGIAAWARNNARIEFCKNLGTIKANLNQSIHAGSYAGGLIAYTIDAVVTSSYNAGDVTSDNYSTEDMVSHAGGLIAMAENTKITNVFNTGSVTANANGKSYYTADVYSNVGGIIAKANTGVVLQLSYNAGIVSASAKNRGYVNAVGTRKGSLIGYNCSSGKIAPVLTNCYWLSSVGNSAIGANDGSNTQSNVKALTDEEMKKQESFEGFPFGYFWTMEGNKNYSYPELIGLEYTSKMDECDHGEFSAWSTVKAATCTEKGKEQRTCAACGYVEYRDTDTTEHTWTSKVTKEATHTSAGERTYTCTICGTVKIETIPKTYAHTYGAWISDNSNTHSRTCVAGDDKQTEPHKWNSGVVTKAATHTTTGTKTYTCTVCGGTKTETVPKTSTHTYGAWVSDGSDTHSRTCVTGDDRQTEPHKWNSGVVTKAATHTATGTKTYTCTVCGDTKTENIKKLPDHTFGAWTYEDNDIHKRSCECGETEVEGHSWSTGVVTKAATHTETGIMTYSCTVCGGSKTETIEKLPDHTYGAWVSDGDDTHSRTCISGDDTQTEEHNWGEGVVTVAPTKTANGTKTYTCPVCCAVRTETIEKLPDDMTSGSGTENTAATGESTSSAAPFEGMTVYIVIGAAVVAAAIITTVIIVIFKKKRK